MDIHAIQTFVEVARRGSFAAVARSLGCAPSSVSRSIASLEDELGVRLFQRTTRQLDLTEAGEAYRDEVEPLLADLIRAGDVARDLVAVPRGTLRVAVAASFAQMHLARWLPGFLRRHPEIDVELVLDVRYVDLAANRIDVAVRLGRAESPSSIARVLCDMPRVVVASPERLCGRQLRTPDDLAGEDCLLFPFDGYTATWRFRDTKGEISEFRPKPRFVAADGMVLRELALAGMGFSLLPRWLCAEDIRLGRLVDAFPSYDVSGTRFDAKVLAVYPTRKYLPLKVRAFLDYLGELFRDGPPWEAS
jgi:DNA-binding transcriptional LysR family regulator